MPTPTLCLPPAASPATPGPRPGRKPRIGSLFTGVGGLDQGVRAVVGGDVAWHCESDPAASAVLAHHHPNIPNLGDITTVDWAGVEPVDVLAGGFPCQDLSTAGRRTGLRVGTRSGLWSVMADAIDTLRPALVVAENVRGLLSSGADSDVEPCPWCMGDGNPQRVVRALGVVLGDLADLGYDASWCGLRAADVGAPHGRYRIFITAWPAVQDPDSAAGHQRRLPAPRQAQGRRTRPDARRRGGAPAAHADGVRQQGQPEPDGATVQPGRGVLAGDDADGLGVDIDWGDYRPAIRQWEAVLGRRAPAPTTVGARGNAKLSPLFVEWMMGLPAGWVTGVPGVTVNQQLKMLGNGVVPQQCAAAVQWLLEARAGAVSAVSA